jgi:hypothetical protein
MNRYFYQFVWRVAATHTVTYFAAGLVFSGLFNYTILFDEGALSIYMRPTSSEWVAAGPALNVFRGILFGAVLWTYRDLFVVGAGAWLRLWLIFVTFAIFGTAAAAPGSIEGVIYTTLPLEIHLKGLPEVLIQTLLFSWMLTRWLHKPEKSWDIVMGVLLGCIFLMSTAGVLLR